VCLSSHSIAGLLTVGSGAGDGSPPVPGPHVLSDVGHCAPKAELTSAMKAAAASSGLVPPSETLS